MRTLSTAAARGAALVLVHVALLAVGQAAAGTVRLVDGWGGGALSATDTAAFARVAVAAPRDGWTSQRWSEERVSGNVYRYRNLWSGQYLNAAAERDGAAVEAAPLDAGWTSQQWRREEAGDGRVRLRNVWNGRYLNATGSGDWSGVDTSALVGSWGSQRWLVDAIDGVGDDTGDGTGDDTGDGGGPDEGTSAGTDGGTDAGANGGANGGADAAAAGVGPDIVPGGDVRRLVPGEDVQAAVDAAAPGSTVQLGAGTWTGVSVNLTKRVTIDGVAGTVLEGGGAAEAFGIFDGADGAVVQDLTIRNYTDGIHVAGADRVTLRNLTLTDIGSYSGDSFSNIDTAIQVDDSTGSRVANNTIRGAAQKGIGVGVSVDVDVVDNVIRDINLADAYDPNWNVGAIKYFAASGTIAGNEASNVHGNAIWVDTSRYVLVRDNRAYANEDGGIYMEKTPASRVENNDAGLIIATRWTLDNGTTLTGNDVATTVEPDYWNCGGFDCAADERNRAYGTTSSRTDAF